MTLNKTIQKSFDTPTILAYWNAQGIYYPYAKATVEYHQLMAMPLSEMLMLSIPLAFKDRTFLSCLRTWLVFHHSNSIKSDFIIASEFLDQCATYHLIMLLFLLHDIDNPILLEASSKITHVLHGRHIHKSLKMKLLVYFVHLINKHLFVYIPFRKKIRSLLMGIEMSFNTRMLPRMESSNFVTNALFSSLDDFFADYGVVMARIGLSPYKVARLVTP